MPHDHEAVLRTLTAILCALASTSAHAQRLNDTGVVIGGEALQGNHTSCSGADIAQQDCSTGRDALARAGKLAKVGGGVAGFDFTRFCNSGEAAGAGACPAVPKLGPAANDWACTKDNVTGLLWEVKTADDGLRDRDRTYTNYSVAYNPSREQGSAADAAGYLRAVDEQRLCGAAGWRLPTRIELAGLLHYGAAAPAPAIDAAYFPNPPSKPAKSVHWASSGFAGNVANAWGVDASDGVAGDDNRSIYYSVRLVWAPPLAQRVASADGEVIRDARTNLIWRRCAEGMTWSGSTCAGVSESYTWVAALTRGRQQAAVSREDWRLPDLKELASIVDDSRIAPAIDVTLFPATPAAGFWSATPASSHPAYTWTVNFQQGHLGDHGYRGDRYKLRLVRNAR